MEQARAPSAGMTSAAATAGAEYTERLLETARWKRLLDVQAPYRWHLRRLRLGRTLDVGCGIGRNLAHLGPGAVGVDHNPTSVRVCRGRGLAAYLVEDFPHTPYAQPGSFDTLLAAHLVEHLSEPAAVRLLRRHLPYLRLGGRLVLITPQERGYASDATHVRFVGFAQAAALATALGLTVLRQYSFPLPRAVGKLFTYNEFVTVAGGRGGEGGG